MSKAQSLCVSVDELLEAACARNVPAELHYENRQGTISIGRARLLAFDDKEILADRPLYVEADSEIPADAPITVHVRVDGARLQFNSAISAINRFVRLNARHIVPGIALRKPKTFSPSQRRASLRISLANIDPINVVLARPHRDIPDACWIDAEPIRAWLIDLSAGGVSVLADRTVLGRARRGEPFFLSFVLGPDEDEFNMLGTVRQSRVVEASNSLRVGLGFRPWRGGNFTRDQQRISRVVTTFERRLLRRRK